MKALHPLFFGACALLTLAACKDTAAPPPMTPAPESTATPGDAIAPAASPDTAAPPPGESAAPTPSPPAPTPPTLPEDRPPTDPMDPPGRPLPPT
ncbi:hypothetical protein [Brevundimonas sp.]|uniref:hypothetical protein n=1 Tax=Brevundimonas sp. TaxID=1871086 RepID=UPI00289B307C|nr:hypothetical protein [Brevundimonas sp.]